MEIVIFKEYSITNLQNIFNEWLAHNEDAQLASIQYQAVPHQGHVLYTVFVMFSKLQPL